MALVTFVNDSPPYLNANNLNNNFTELNNKIIVEEETISNLTLNGNTCIYENLSSVTKTGYTLIDISVTLTGPGNGYILVSAKSNGLITLLNASSTAREGIGITAKKIFLKN